MSVSKEPFCLARVLPASSAPRFRPLEPICPLIGVWWGGEHSWWVSPQLCNLSGGPRLEHFLDFSKLQCWLCFILGTNIRCSTKLQVPLPLPYAAWGLLCNVSREQTKEFTADRWERVKAVFPKPNLWHTVGGLVCLCGGREISHSG